MPESCSICEAEYVNEINDNPALSKLASTYYIPAMRDCALFGTIAA